MRTTIRMDEELARRAKRFAARTNRSFTQLIEEAVAEFVSRRAEPSRPTERITFPVVGDPKRKMTEEQYRRMIERMYEEEAEHIMTSAMKGGGAGRGRA